MKKLYFIVILISSNIFAQSFGIEAKYSTTFNKEYVAYNSLLLNGSLLLLDNKFELNAIVGVNYSHLQDNVFEYYNNSLYSYYDDILISKSIFGGGISYYPITFISIYTPFFGVRGAKFYDNKLFLPMGGGMWSDGYYYFRTTNDFSYSFLSGIKISPTKINNINIIVEIEYQNRNFILEYEEYINNLLLELHSEKHSIVSLNFAIGLQFVF